MNKKRVNFSIFRANQRWDSPTQHDNLKVLECENADKNGKRALHAVTTRNKCLK